MHHVSVSVLGAVYFPLVIYFPHKINTYTHYRWKHLCFQLRIFKSCIWTVTPMSFIKVFSLCIEYIHNVYQLSSLLVQLHTCLFKPSCLICCWLFSLPILFPHPTRHLRFFRSSGSKQGQGLYLKLFNACLGFCQFLCSFSLWGIFLLTPFTCIVVLLALCQLLFEALVLLLLFTSTSDFMKYY